MSAIQQSPAIRALGVELGQAVRRDRDRARRQRQHRLRASGGLIVAVLVSCAVLAHPFAGPPRSSVADNIVDRAPARAREAPPPASASGMFLPAEFWRHQQAGLLN